MLKLRLLISVCIFSAISVFMAVSFAGCQQEAVASVLVTPEGVQADVFLPKNPFVVIKVGATDQDQIEKLAKIYEKFPQGDISLLVSGLIAEMDAEFEEMNLTVEKDFMVATGNNIQGVLAMEMPKNLEDEPVIIGVVVLGDPRKADEILEKIMIKGEHQKQSYGSAVIYLKEGEDGVIARYKDVLVITGTEIEIKKAIDRLKDRKKSVLSNKFYQEAVKKTESSFGFFYIGFDSAADLFKEMKSDESYAAELEKYPGMNAIFDALKSEYFIVTAEEDGFAVYGYVEGDPKKLKEFGLDYGEYNLLSPYLLEKVKGENIIFYTENGGISQMLTVYEKIYGEYFTEIINTVKSVLAGLGISFRDDLLASMDKNYALAIRDTGGFLPAVDFYYDAGSKPKSADKTMQVLNLFIKNFIEENNPELFESGVVISDVHENRREYSLTLDINALPEEELLNVPREIKEMPFDFYFGVGAGHIAYFAFDSDYHSQEKTIIEDEELKNALKHIEGYDVGLSYIDVSGVLDYTERLVAFAKSYDDGIADSDLEDFNKVVEYLRPVKSIIAASRQSDTGGIEMKAFVEIGQGK